jgi:6-phosphogluconolactonase
MTTARTPVGAGPRACPLYVYVGTYTRGRQEEEGIHLFHMDLAGGKLEDRGVVGQVTHPSFLAIHPSRCFLYSVSEVASMDGTSRGGGVSAFAIDANTGSLALLNQECVRGAGPCHLCVDPSGKVLLVANYGDGTVTALPIRDSGRVDEPTAFIQHSGSSVDPQRQEGPHAHSINTDAAGRFAFAADLGLDKILIYRLDARLGTLEPHDPPAASVEPGAGPRHFAFHPSGRFAYVINEMGNTVTAFRYDPEAGRLATLQTIPTLPEGFTGQSWTAEVLVHPSGKFLYGSNRGHDSIALFAIDESTGRLTAIGHEPTQGRTPRNFGIDPTGRYLLAANQESDTIVQFRIDGDTGRLTATGEVAHVYHPVCVRMIRAA